MPHALIRILTATALFAHGLLGCCWHHAHGAPTSCAGIAADHAFAAEGCHHHSRGDDLARHDSASPETGDHHSDTPGDPTCGAEQCVFLRMHDKADFSTQALLAAHPLGAVAGGLLLAVAPESSRSAAPGAPPPCISEPLYALHQVWLI